MSAYPPPWEIEYGHDGAEDGVIFVTCEKSPTLWAGDARDKTDVDTARLISAAPDLYAALKELYDMLYKASDGDRIWTLGMQLAARTALAKAAGLASSASAYPPAAEEPEDEPPTPTQHSVSTETLHHFRCGSCGLWWSIADDPTPKALRSCPHCGTKGRVEELA